MTRIRCLLCMGMLAGLAGCGAGPGADYGKVELISAGGKVTLEGEPLAEAVVTFEAEDGQFSYGLTDASGRYNLQYDSQKAGVRAGKKVVRISTTKKILGLNSEEEGGEAPTEGAAAAAPAVEKVPERYNKKSELQIEVTPDKKTYDFELAK